MPISSEELASGLAQAEFEWRGQACHVTYKLDRINKDFNRRMLLLQRRMLYLAREQDRLEKKYGVDNEAEEGTPEYDAAEAAAVAAGEQIQANNEEARRAVDRLVIEVTEEWDVVQKDGSMYPIEADTVSRLPMVFKAALLKAVVESAQLGEANGSSLPSNLRIISQPAEQQETGLPFQTSTGTSS